MKYIIVGNGEIYSLPNKIAEQIEEDIELAEKADYTNDIIDYIKKHGKYVGTAFSVVRY